jgi:hypothetical protein
MDSTLGPYRDPDVTARRGEKPKKKKRAGNKRDVPAVDGTVE